MTFTGFYGQLGEFWSAFWFLILGFLGYHKRPTLKMRGFLLSLFPSLLPPLVLRPGLSSISTYLSNVGSLRKALV